MKDELLVLRASAEMLCILPVAVRMFSEIAEAFLVRPCASLLFLVSVVY